MLLQPSFLIHVDFLTITESDTLKEPHLMHPSVATSCNEIKRIDNAKDIENLAQEFRDKNLYESILKHHNRSRTGDSDSIITSKVKILAVTNIFVQIVPIEWD